MSSQMPADEEAFCDALEELDALRAERGLPAVGGLPLMAPVEVEDSQDGSVFVAPSFQTDSTHASHLSLPAANGVGMVRAEGG